MQRITPYLGIVAALLVGAFVVAFSGSENVVRPIIVASTTPPSLAVFPGFTVPALVLPNLQSTTIVATTAPVLAEPIPKKVAPLKTTSAPTPTPVVVAPSVSEPVSTPPPSASSAKTPLADSASALRTALVNIICRVPTGSNLHSISGSGVVIDSKGIILTNAHVAQYFLLADRGASCVIRSGSPASDCYTAALIYISPVWLQTNPNVLTQTEPTGTGEYDFALLAVTSSATTTVILPSSFPYLPLAKNPPLIGTPVAIASYGAQFLESSQIQSALFPTVVFSSVKDVFTFTSTTIDVLAFGGSAAAQEGSSGGGVANASGKLVGTITTSATQGTVNERSLDAITASYIRAEYASETGKALDLLLAQPTDISIADFASQISVLEKIITAGLP